MITNQIHCTHHFSSKRAEYPSCTIGCYYRGAPAHDTTAVAVHMLNVELDWV